MRCNIRIISVSLAAAGMFLLSTPSGGTDSAQTAKTKGMNMKSLFITYKRPMAPPGSLSQVVTAQNGCFLTVTGPMVGVDLPEKAEIGRYKTSFDAREFDKLLNLATSAVHEGSAAQNQPLPKGTLFLTFGIGEIGKELESISSAPMSTALPPAANRFDTAMISVAKHLLEHPLATLKGAASISSSRAIFRQDLDVKFSLKNSGTVPVTIRNPAAAEINEETGVEIQIEKNLPAETMEDTDRAYIPIKRKDIKSVHASWGDKNVKSKPLVRLDPGNEMVFHVKVKRNAFFGKNTYRGWVTFVSLTGGIPSGEAVDGRLMIPVGTFTVE